MEGDGARLLMRGIELVQASSIKPTRLKMLWRQRIPAATLSIIAGKPGLGKSTLATMIAAELSRRGKDVMISNFEDDLAAVIRPRLEVAHADLDRVHLVPAGEQIVFPRDLDDLVPLIVATQAKALILDPIAAHFQPERRVHDRPTLNVLVQIARQTGCAIIGVHHTTKNTAGGPLNAVGGPAGGLAGTARAVYLYGYDPEDEDRRALACVKVNGLEEPPALILEHDTIEYRSSRVFVEAGALRVVHESTARARSVLSPGRRHKDRDAAALEWLTNYLAGGEDCKRTVREIHRHALAKGLPWATVKRVAIVLKRERLREGGWGAHGYWSWRLPSDHPSRPENAEVEAVDAT